MNINAIGKKEENKQSMSVQEFMNVKDIDQKFLYTNDNFVISYIKINPIRLELLSHREKVNLTEQLTVELSAIKEEWKFLAVSRPLDIYPLIQSYVELKNESEDLVQKELLRKEIEEISTYAMSGEIVERQFYFMIWETFKEGVEKSLQKRALDFASAFESCGIRTEILKKVDIIKLCNLVHNPAYVTTEDMDVKPVIPILMEG